MIMNETKIICPICKTGLDIDNKRAVCINNHSFDRAKEGYLNLLLNHPDSGDNKIMINARNNILEKGYFAPLLEKIISVLKTYNIDSLLDVGCGEGYYSRHLYNELKVPTYGIDISKYACLKASKLSKDITYIVASSYELPFFDKSVDAIINVFAPHSFELERVSRRVIVKVVPNLYHLWELKDLLYDEAYLKESNEGEFKTFSKKEEVLLSYKVTVDQLEDLVKMTPYYYKSKINSDIFSTSNLEMTMDFKIILYEPR